MADSEQSKRGESVKDSAFSAPCIMKVDEVKNETIEQENENNQIKSTANKEPEDFKVCSPSVKITTTTTNHPFATSHQNKASGILKPPQLSFNNSGSSKSFILKPSSLNPFNKPQDNNSNGSSDSNNSSSTSSNVQNGEAVPKFVPLVQSGPKPAPAQPNITKPTTPATTSLSSSSSSSTPSSMSSSSAPLASATGFVFGQNLQERVINPAAPLSTTTNKDDEPKPSTSLSTNGTSEMLFSSAVKDTSNSTNSKKETTTKSLSESAREYEESRANKRKYEEVEVITGEEEETNILSMGCKLFAFDKTTGSWQERGRGNLRLNDFEVNENHTQSRLVFRTTGSLRVVLNTKIWAEMTIEQASEKSIRLTALDANGEIKVFLIMANIEDTKNLFSQLKYRLQKEIASQKHKKHNPSTTTTTTTSTTATTTTTVVDSGGDN